MFYEGTLTFAGTINNLGGAGGRGGEYVASDNSVRNFGLAGVPGRNGRTIIAKHAVA
jgi:hypothetical protein